MKKPASLTVLGILNICFASLGLLGGLFGLLPPFIPLPGSEVFAGVYKDMTFLLIVSSLVIVGLFSKLAMLGSGVGLLQGKPWGRSLGRGWAVFSIVYGLIAVGVGVLYTMPAMNAAVDAYATQHPNLNQPVVRQQKMTRDVVLVSTLVMGVAQATIYQFVFLVFISGESARSYFAACESTDKSQAAYDPYA